MSNRASGSPILSVRNRGRNINTPARRAAYLALIGSLNGDKLIDGCGTNGCCNPAHARVIPKEYPPGERPSAQRAYFKEHYKNNQRRYKHNALKAKFGIGINEFEQMLIEQDGACAICKLRFDPNNKANRRTTPCVDHDHGTGAVRSLLCVCCNAGLGGFQDDPALLSAAADYLERHKAAK